MDFHWDNYINFCAMCAVKYDFIGHYETLEEDLADLVAAASISAEDIRYICFVTSVLFADSFGMDRHSWLDVSS